VALAAAAALVAAWFWLGSGLSGWTATRRWPHLPAADVVVALGRLPGHLSAPGRAWPVAVPGTPLSFYAWCAVVAAGAAVCAVGARRAWGSSGGPRPRRTNGACWARGRDLRPLAVRRPPGSGRVVLGTSEVGGRLLATEARHSLLVIGPTQSGKTTGLAIPAILEWRGPIVATSVKDDLAAATIAWRSRLGPTSVFDPTRSSGLAPLSRWSPLSECASWSAAQKMATWLVESTPSRTGMADAAFWYATAGKQLAPLLLAAATGGMTVAEIVRWTNSEDYVEPTHLLELAGEHDAVLALAACAGRDERIRSSVTTTLETVLAPFEDPVVASSTATTDGSVEELLAAAGTLYLCGPSSEQGRVQGLFAALVSTVVATAIRRVSSTGRPLSPPLLLVLDEAANVAPVRDLDTLASTGAGLGINLVTVCQDLAQMSARYGTERARTIANNHRAKLLLSGVSDLGTLDLISGLAGEQAVREETTTHDLRHGGRTRSTSTVMRRLAPTDELRRVAPGDGVLVYGHLPPVRLRLRPYYANRALRRRAGGGQPAGGGGGLRARLGATRGGSPGIFGYTGGHGASASPATASARDIASSGSSD
jgi:type IV secretion system protein VirD4